jgi:glycogen operon protein
MLAPPASENGPMDDFLYVALNSYWETLAFELPPLGSDQAWHIAADSSATAPDDIHTVGAEPRLQDQEQIRVGGRSAVVLVGR